MEKKKPIDRIWSFLSSIKLAIVVFSLIALTSIVGTVLEQNAAPEKNLEVLSRLFGEGIAPSAYRFFDTLGFMDMYRSWWFTLLLGLFATNLLVCSIDRFPAIWRLANSPIKPLAKDGFTAMQIKAELAAKGKPDAIKPIVLKAIKSAGFKPLEDKEEGGGYQLYSQKGAWSRMGILISHFSILMILIGAVIGIQWGFKAFINILEGTKTSMVFARQQLTSRAEFNERNRLLDMLEATGGDVDYLAGSLNMNALDLKKRMRRLGIVPLDFSVKCEDFEIDYYPASNMPKSYRSLLEVEDGGAKVAKKWIEVNSPLKYKGVTFYQSSYGVLPDTSPGVAHLRITSNAGLTETKSLRTGEGFVIPGTETEVRVAEFVPTLMLDEMGRLVSAPPQGRGDQGMTNPALRLEIKHPGGPVTSKWVLKRVPDSWKLPEGHSIEFSDFWGVQYTGLQARKDPGVWVVYLGCLTLSIGLFMAFFMNHKKLWVRVVPEKGGLRISLAAYANKNRQSLEGQIEKIKALLLAEGGK